MKSTRKNATDITLRLSYMIGANKVNSPHNFLLTDIQVSSLGKAFANKIIYQ